MDYESKEHNMIDKDGFNLKIEQLNKIVMGLDISSLPMGLFNGKMGICIYYYYASKYYENSDYQLFAGNLLDDIYGSINDNILNIDFQNGVSGVAWGINYLIENKFVLGNLDLILHDIDNLLFSQVNFCWLNDESKNRMFFLWLLFYYSDRLKTVKNEVEREMMQRTVIRIINHVEDNCLDIPLYQPKNFNINYSELSIYSLVLSRFYLMDFYNYKIVKIVESISDTLLSSFPVQHTNRLLLLWSIQNVQKCVYNGKLENHMILLKDNIDHGIIINKEFLNKNLSLCQGVAGYVLILLLNKYKISLELKKRILEKIDSSYIWDNGFDPLTVSTGNNIGLFNGYTGVALMYHILLNNV